MILKTTVLFSWAVTASFGAPAKLPLQSGPQVYPNPSNSFEIPLPAIPSGLYELPEAGSSPPRHTIPGNNAQLIFPEPSQSVSHFQPLENEFPAEDDPFPGPDSDAVEVRKPISTAHLENKTGVEEAGPPVPVSSGVIEEAELPPEITNAVPDVDPQAEILPNPKADMPPMPYAFDFDVSDNIGGVYFSRQEEQKVEGPLTGSYSYLRPDGIYMTVIYEADESGYRARVIETKALPEHLQSQSTGTASARVQLPQSSRIAWKTTENSLQENKPKSLSDDSNGHQRDSFFSHHTTEKQESIAWPDAGPQQKDTQSEVLAKESLGPLEGTPQEEILNNQKDITAISVASTHGEEKAESPVPSGEHSHFHNILQKQPQPPVFHQDQEQQIVYEEGKQNSENLQHHQNTNSEFNLSTGDNETQHPGNDVLEVQDQSASTDFQENLTPFQPASTGFGESPANKESVKNSLDKKGIFSANPVQLTGSKPSNPSVFSLPEDQQIFQQGPVQHKFSEEIQRSQEEETAITVEESNPINLSVPAVQEENHLNIEDDGKPDRPSSLNDQLPSHTVILEKELVEKRLQENAKTDDQTNQPVDEDVEPQPSNTISASKGFTEDPNKPTDTAVQDEVSAKLTPAEVDADATATSVTVDTHFDPLKSPVHLHRSEHVFHNEAHENAQLPAIHPHYSAAFCEECTNDERTTGINDRQSQSATQSLAQDSQQENSNLGIKQQSDFPEVNNLHENGEDLISDDIYTTESVITGDESLSGIIDNEGGIPFEPNLSESEHLSNQFPSKELHSESTEEEYKHLPNASNNEQNRDNSELIIQHFPNNPFFQKKEPSDQVQPINLEYPRISIQPNNRDALGTTNLQGVHTVLPARPQINLQNEETFTHSAGIHNTGPHLVPQFQANHVNQPLNNQMISETGLNDNQNTYAEPTIVNMPAALENIFTDYADSYDYNQPEVALHANSNPDDSARPLLRADSEDTFQGLPVKSYSNFYPEQTGLSEQTHGHNTHPGGIKAEAIVQPQSELRQTSQSTETDELSLDSKLSEQSNNRYSYEKPQTPLKL